GLHHRSVIANPSSPAVVEPVRKEHLAKAARAGDLWISEHEKRVVADEAMTQARQMNCEGDQRGRDKPESWQRSQPARHEISECHQDLLGARHRNEHIDDRSGSAALSRHAGPLSYRRAYATDAHIHTILAGRGRVHRGRFAVPILDAVK